MVRRIIILPKSIIEVHQHLLNLLTTPPIFSLIIVNLKLSPCKNGFQGIRFINLLH